MSMDQPVPAISIIVPVYKAESYLSQCVDSILNQTYTDFELLLVDDGSPDGSGQLCDEYAEKDARIQVIHKENGGVSSARNAGLDAARGEYFVFIDSDDYVDADYLSGMLEALRRSGDAKTLVITDYQPFTELGLEERTYPEAFTVDCDAGSAEAQEFRDLVFGFRVFPPYCKLYRRDVIETAGLRFDTVMKSAEDFDFNMRYIEQINRICYAPCISYHYRVGYKKYVPSDRGVLGESEIRSVHCMAHGIVNFAKRLGVYEEEYDELCIWAAKKHYFNRLPMVFAENREISTAERRKKYKELISDDLYRSLYQRGVSLLPPSTTKSIGCRCDCFISWELFYTALHRKKKK